jgi:glycosyltransferase involved in cell wall biosynthesis
VLRDEEELYRRSGLVVTTSIALQEVKSPWNPNTIFVPRSVDYDHFSREAHEDLPCSVDMVAIPRPRLGFFGLIRNWVDVELLAQVAGKRTEWRFVMIGDADSSVDLSKYWSIPNMHFLGRRRYEELPAYCRQFNVGLYEYLIKIADSAAEFEAAVEKCLGHKPKQIALPVWMPCPEKPGRKK